MQRSRAQEMRHLADDMQGLVGRYHDDEGVDRRYLRAVSMLEEGASALERLEGAVEALREAHNRLTELGVPTHDDHGAPLNNVTLRISVLADQLGGQ